MRSRFWIAFLVVILNTSTAHSTAAESVQVKEQGMLEKVVTIVKNWWDNFSIPGISNPKPQQPAVAFKTIKGQATQTAAAQSPRSMGAPGTAAANGQPVAATSPQAATASQNGTAVAQNGTAGSQVGTGTGNGAGTGANHNLKLAPVPREPLFAEKADRSSLAEMQAARDQLRSSQGFRVAQPARIGTSKLPKTKVGVPVTNWRQPTPVVRTPAGITVKSVPRLDIGMEGLISREDFKVSQLHWALQKPSDLKKQAQPIMVSPTELNALLAMKPQKALMPRGIQGNIRLVSQPITREQVEGIKYTITELQPVKVLPYKPMTEEQMQMVAALLLFNKGNNCPMIMGLFHQAKDADKTKAEATYHLGACAHELKMYQSAFDNLSYLVRTEDKEFGAEALGLLANDLPILYEKEFYTILKNVKNLKVLIKPEHFDNVAYRYAKGAYRASDFKLAGSYADQVSSKSQYTDDARILSAMNSFAMGDKGQARQKLQDLWQSINERGVTNSTIRALTAVNLARMHFARKQYDKALESYMHVPKDHPLWVKALIEQGWTQLALGDYSGAIGNMYSLHSPYFKAVYQPESFVVRTIGYLNICQYGDAYRSLSYLEKDYRNMLSQTKTYLQNKSEPVAVYSSLKSYIRGKSTDNVDGVPFQVWREMGHQRQFLNIQTALNDKLDETKRYDGVNEKIKTEKASIRWKAEQAKKRFDQWKSQLAKLATDRNLIKNKDLWTNNMNLERDLTIGYRFQLAILEQSRSGFIDYQGKAQKKLDQETASLSTKAGESILRRAKNMSEEMGRVLENNEFLRYEVFSGSGENIRYQVAGGEVGNPNRVPAHIKPTKMMNWSFDGEFWEDEIGSYRSRLQNACPTTQESLAGESQPTPQAKLIEGEEE